MKVRKGKILLFCVALCILGINLLTACGSHLIPSILAEGQTSGWFYDGWQYRTSHNITEQQTSIVVDFYDLSAPSTTILGNPTARHAFQPVHNTAMLEVDKLVDGAIQKYLAYDSDPAGSAIRLYYTNDTSGVWTPYSHNPILGPSSYHYRWPSTAYVNDSFQMFLADRTDGALERWTSTDGINYTFSENIRTGGNEFKNPYIWYNSNDNKWYLYSHDTSGVTEYFRVRNASKIEDLDATNDVTVVSRTIPLGSPTVTFYGGKYWLLGEILENGIWKVAAYYSTTSASSGFKECYNSPIISDDTSCPMFLLNVNQTQAFLFSARDSLAWYEDTREVYLNSSTSPQLPDQFDYQIRIKAFYTDGSDSDESVYLNGHSRADFGDLRFTWLNSSIGSETPCPYWIEELTPNSTAILWVKIPEISGKSYTTIYIYYGKSDATTTSNGEATFEFFDDFSGTLSKWTVTGGTWNIENGELSAQTNAYGQRITAKNFNFGNDSVHVKEKWISGTYFEGGPYIRAQSPNEPSNGYITILSTWAYDNRQRISRMLSGWETTIASQGTVNPSRNVWYSYIFEACGNTLKSTISPIYPTEINATDGTFQNGTLSLFSWSASSEHIHYDDLFVCKYLNPGPIHVSWGNEETGNLVTIDQAIAGDERANVGSQQTVDFHARWTSNGSDIVGGSILVNGTEHVTNNTGWIDIGVSASAIGKDTWTVTGVNCSGVTEYIQTAPSPSVIWDRIEITQGGVAKNPAFLGENVTVWFKAIFDYDRQVFSQSSGLLYANGTQMVWSMLENQWEYTCTPTTLDPQTIVVSHVEDSLYGLTNVEDAAGPQTFNVWSPWSSPFSVVSNSTISELVFDSSAKTLSFTVVGPSGSVGCTNITIQNSLIANISELAVYIDGNLTNYSATAMDGSWLLTFTYHHSTHKVVVILGSTHTNPTLEAIMLYGLAASLLSTFLLIRKRKIS